MNRHSQNPFPIYLLRATQAISGCVLLTGVVLVFQKGGDFFITADQRGQRLMDQKQYAKAAETFADPFRQSVALYRAGEYKKAASWFGGLPSAEAAFNQGNSLVMQGKYKEAVAQYDRALELHPNWKAAITNREIAEGRAKRMETEGGDMTGGMLAPDEIVFDNKKSSGEQTETTEGTQELSDQEMRSIWLRQVQTTPSDFLRTKFAYQQATSAKEVKDD